MLLEVFRVASNHLFLFYKYIAYNCFSTVAYS